MKSSKVGIVGCGLMGSGITQVVAQNGYETIVREVNDNFLKKGLDRVKNFMQEGVKRGKLKEEDITKTLTLIKSTTNLADLADCDIIIEAIIEDMNMKKELFKELDSICKKETILASNTSSLSITQMASVTKRPNKCIGMHFFNPVPVMKLIEIVRPEITSQQTYDTIKAFGESLGKIVVTAKDTPGFIVNLLLVPFLLDAIRSLENGVATKEDIDTAVKLGLNHPMGPLELADFVGLDTTLYIADIMYNEFKDTRYAAPPLLKRMVTAGFIGRKSGRGFYNHSK